MKYFLGIFSMKVDYFTLGKHYVLIQRLPSTHSDFVLASGCSGTLMNGICSLRTMNIPGSSINEARSSAETLWLQEIFYIGLKAWYVWCRSKWQLWHQDRCHSRKHENALLMSWTARDNSCSIMQWSGCPLRK